MKTIWLPYASLNISFFLIYANDGKLSILCFQLMYSFYVFTTQFDGTRRC